MKHSNQESDTQADWVAISSTKKSTGRKSCKNQPKMGIVHLILINNDLYIQTLMTWLKTLLGISKLCIDRMQARDFFLTSLSSCQLIFMHDHRVERTIRNFKFSSNTEKTRIGRYTQRFS